MVAILNSLSISNRPCIQPAELPDYSTMHSVLWQSLHYFGSLVVYFHVTYSFVPMSHNAEVFNVVILFVVIAMLQLYQYSTSLIHP